MRIAMIGQKGYPALSGGIERHVHELVNKLAERDLEVLVFCRPWYSAEKSINPKITQIFVPTIRTKHLDAIVHSFLSILVAAYKNVDIYHIHGVGPALLAWLPKLLRPSAKVIVTFHCIDRLHQKWGWFARAVLKLGEVAACRLPDKTIVVSKTLLEYTRETYDADPIYIPNGVNIPSGESNVKLLKKFKLEPNKYLVMVSRLVEHKGQKTLINAWKVARAQKPELFKNMKLAVVGGGAFTEDYVEELKKLAGDDVSIILTGEQTGETLHSLFANAYAAVHPSVLEGLPIVVLEAMSYGKCVLASDISEHLEVTKNHGLSFRAGDVEDLAEKMIAIIEAPELVAHVGSGAAKFVKDNFAWNEIATQTEMLYKKAEQEHAGSAVAKWLTRGRPML
jgi:glycosyltransferase involved in cell wall biosynthesis